ncbi:MAG: hypothetical protein V1733_06265 [bacterium]
MRYRPALLIACSILVGVSTSFSQSPTFGDLIPDIFLPPTVDRGTPLNCSLYFYLADSINKRIFQITGVNPLPPYRCGNDSLSFSQPTIQDALQEISPGSILFRMIIDRRGRPVCCKVYIKEGPDAGKELEQAFSKLTFMPGYRNGQPIVTECRFLYNLQTAKLSTKKFIE